MACGEKRLVLDSFWTWCTFHWSYPCGLRYCTSSFSYPCGITTCRKSYRYPCGVRWCRKWGVRYPCGIRYCRATISYPCLQYCTATVTYPCGFEYCRGTGYYPCRRYHEVSKYCYDYSSARESCTVVASKLTFCCDGQEYSAWSPCLGWVSAIHGPGTACYDEPLKSSGPCTSASMPPGGPAQPLDPGSVAPHTSGGAALTGSRNLSKLTRSKLGSCARCMRAVLVISAASWTAVSLSVGWQAVHYAFFILAALSTALLLAHVIAFIMRQPRSPAASCSCGRTAGYQLEESSSV
jgi:hypothetical protein